MIRQGLYLCRSKSVNGFLLQQSLQYCVVVFLVHILRLMSKNISIYISNKYTTTTRGAISIIFEINRQHGYFLNYTITRTQYTHSQRQATLMNKCIIIYVNGIHNRHLIHVGMQHI